jgi:hypothetical protein
MRAGAREGAANHGTTPAADWPERAPNGHPPASRSRPPPSSRTRDRSIPIAAAWVPRFSSTKVYPACSAVTRARLTSFEGRSTPDRLLFISYIGKVRYKDEVHVGEHDAIVDPDTWQKVQTVLQRNGRGGAPIRNQCGALLKGLLRCVPCDCAMTPSHSTKKGTKR